jgi:glutaminyl-peptide cyclotransferase
MRRKTRPTTARPNRAPSSRFFLRGQGILIAVGLACAVALGLWLWLAENKTASADDAQRLKVKVISVRPHDRRAFTQGLLLHNGSLYESTGLYGQSSLRQVNPQTGEVLRLTSLTPDLFGEGLERVGTRLIQLTWREHVAPYYDLDTFEPMGEYEYTTEGWGLCFNGQELIMSDGSDVLMVRNPDTFEPIRPVKVTCNGQPLGTCTGQPRGYLNELEWAEGSVYANVWYTDTIVRIDPQNGQVTAIIDASKLLTAEEEQRADVLNGIAYDPEKKTFLITGKRWPKLFEVVFVPIE